MRKILKIISFILLFTLLFTSVAYAATEDDVNESFINTLPLACYDYSTTGLDSVYTLDEFYDMALTALSEKYGVIDISEHYVFVSGGDNKLSFDFYYLDNVSFDYYITSSGVLQIDANFSPWYSSSADGVYTRTYYRVNFILSESGTINTSFATDNTSAHLLITMNTSVNAYPVYTHGTYTQTAPLYYPIYRPIAHYNASVVLFISDLDGNTHELFYMDDSEEDSSEEPEIDIPVPGDEDGDITDPNFSGLLKGIVKYFNQFLGKIKGYFAGVTSVISSFKESVSSFLTDISAALSEIWTSLENFAAAVVAWFADLIDSVTSGFDGIKNFFAKFISIFDTMYQYGLDDSGNFSLSKMISTIFLPNDVYFRNKFDSFWSSNFSWILYGKTIFNSIINMFTDAASSPTAPEIVIPAGTYGSFVLQQDVIWSFDWYLEFKPMADKVIAAFIYLVFIYRMITSLPSIINGVASPFVSGVNSDRARKEG